MYKGSYTPAVRSNPVTPVSTQPKAVTTVEAQPAEKKKAKGKTKSKAKAQAKSKAKEKPEHKAKPEPKTKPEAKVKEVPDFIAGLPGNPQVQEVPLSDIDLENTQFQLRASIRVGDLAENIKRHGQRVPVLLKGQKPPYQIVYGFRRIGGIQKIGWTKVNAIVVARISEAEALMIAVLENEYRKTYSDLDRAAAIHRLREKGKTVKEIAEEVFHLSPRRIENLEKLLTFDKVLLTALENEEIPTAQAIILQQAKGKHANLDLKAWLGRVEKEQLSYHKLRGALRKEYGAKKGNGKPPELFREIKGKDGDISLRFRPVKLDPKAMTKEEAGRIKSMLERALELVNKITG